MSPYDPERSLVSIRNLPLARTRNAHYWVSQLNEGAEPHLAKGECCTVYVVSPALFVTTIIGGLKWERWT